MAWIESHQELRDHPKTRRAARLLGIGTPQLIGHLHFLWWWAVDYAEDGDLARFDEFDIADAAGWEGDPGQFVAALMQCGPGDSQGFIDPDYTLHDWDDYAGRLIQQREANRERQRRYREKQAATAQQQSTKEARNAHVTRDKGVTNGATLPDPTRPDSTEPGAARAHAREPAPAEDAEHAEPGDEPSPSLSREELFAVKCVRAVRGAATVPAADIVEALHEYIDIRGSPIPSDVLRFELTKFRNHWTERRKNQPANQRWRGWRNALGNWLRKIDVADSEPEFVPLEHQFFGPGHPQYDRMVAQGVIVGDSHDDL